MATQVSLNDGAVASAGALAIQTNGNTQAVSISTGQVATLAQNPILTSGTANGVAYLNGSKVLTTGSGLVFDSSGNLGLGVTPSAFLSTWKVFQIGYTGSLATQTATNIISLDSNRYQNTSNQSIYIQNGYASSYYQYLGQHVWQTAASSTAGNAITFTQAMTLDASGNLLVGKTSTAATSGGGVVYLGRLDAARDDGDVATFKHITAGNTVGSISITASATLYNTTSDQRLKENIQDAAPASALIDAIQVRQYDWKSDGSHQRYGFVAQELVTVAPEAVHQPADPEEMMAVDYSKLVPMLVKEIQSLRKRLAAANL